MDIKWKKSKAVLGFVSFALGVSLLLSPLLPILGSLASGSGRQRLQNALKSDFQETSTFRDYLSELMNNFIAMGAGGPIGGYYYSADEYEQAYLGSGNGLIEAVMVQEADMSTTYIGNSSASQQPSETDRERWKKDAEAWAKQFQEDKNILYYITVNSQVVYTNMDRRKDTIPAFPKQGYSFRLSFNGSKCEATKNEVKLELYGDGIYREDGRHWAVPGYSNFLAGDDAGAVRVYLAVADSPQTYRRANYSSGQWQQWNANQYYYQYRNWQENRRNLVVNSAIMLGVGMLSIAVWFLLRKEKPLADRAIAKVTGHIWFEVKLVLLLGAVVLLFLPLTEDMRYLFQEITYAVFIEDGIYYQTPWFLEQYFYAIVRRPGAVLTAFWVCYLFVNDLRYGDKPWRHGIGGMITARSLKMPIQKRLSRRAVLLAVALLVLGGYITLFIPLLNFDFSRGLRFFLPPALSLLMGLALAIGPRQRRLWSDIGCLADQITAVRNGDFTASPLPADSDLGKASQEVADIQQGMVQAVEEQTRSQRMKVELVTNVSHDLKTPLTSIISYAELLKQEQLEPPAGEYVDILSQKAERLRTMVLDVFEISKAASGELPVKLEPLDLAKLLRQTTADMAEAIEAAPVTLRQALPEEPVTIVADGDRLYRVFQNLLQNALKYALEGSRVYLTLSIQDGVAEASLKNTSKNELPHGVDFTERFVRGDQSRTDGGSGLGLAIADSFTQACGGELMVEPVADLFVVKVRFPLAEREEA